MYIFLVCKSCLCIDSSWTNGTSTLETFYLNFIATQLYAQNSPNSRKIQYWHPVLCFFHYYSFLCLLSYGAHHLMLFTSSMIICFSGFSASLLLFHRLVQRFPNFLTDWQRTARSIACKRFVEPQQFFSTSASTIDGDDLLLVFQNFGLFPSKKIKCRFFGEYF